MVSKTKVENGIARYLDAELMPHLNKGTLPGFATGVAAAFIIKKMDVVFDNLSHNSIVNVLGLMDKEGNVDVEAARDVLRDQMPEEGLYINISNLPLLNIFLRNEQYSMTFHKSDVEKLYGYIMEAGY